MLTQLVSLHLVLNKSIQTNQIILLLSRVIGKNYKGLLLIGGYLPSFLKKSVFDRFKDFCVQGIIQFNVNHYTKIFIFIWENPYSISLSGTKASLFFLSGRKISVTIVLSQYYL